MALRIPEPIRQSKPYHFLHNRYERMNPRTKRIIQNVAATSLLRIVSMTLSFLIVPIALGYLDRERYGVWLTMVSITAWFSNFDIGLGNGLRNRFAKARAENDDHQAAVYVSTTYYLMFFLILGFAVIFCAANPFITWSKVLNTSSSLDIDMKVVPWIAFLAFFLNFYLKLLNTILIADQRPAKSDLINVTVYASTALGLLCLKWFTQPSLILYAIIYSIVPPIVVLIFSIFYFTGRYHNVRPRLSLVDTAYKKDLLGFGVWFFFLASCGVILYSTSNLILSHYLGPVAVVPYNLSQRYFQIGAMGFQIMLGPFWSAVSDAYYRNDFAWIQRTMKQLMRIFLGFAGLMVLMFAGNHLFFKLWVGNKVTVPWMLAGCVCLYHTLNMLNSVLVYFLNGVGKIRVQLIYSAVECVVFVGVVFYALKVLHWGPTSVAVGLCSITLPGIFLYYYQYRKIISKTATGVWDK